MLAEHERQLLPSQTQAILYSLPAHSIYVGAQLIFRLPYFSRAIDGP